ncbi:MAG: hypothetical protein U1C53_02480 [Candidatus Veblenbacteria bacterium]|nr:hypothetical protein [Candidatus Veblenbacteria bacterium]MDZ4229980.1 hypothetical protein [Candidatus Veblenbacteria bacterium]
MSAYFTHILKHPAVVVGQNALMHLAVGLAVSWLVLFAFELLRPGVASLYLDLNLLLALMILSWLLSVVGPPQPSAL